MYLMNYAVNSLPPLCVACGVELPETPDAGEGDGACADCFGESQAKAADQLAKERADQFRFLSLEWFTDLSPAARERKSASYEDNDYETPSLQERYQASFSRAS